MNKGKRATKIKLVLSLLGAISGAFLGVISKGELNIFIKGLIGAVIGFCAIWIFSTLMFIYWRWRMRWPDFRNGLASEKGKKKVR